MGRGGGGARRGRWVPCPGLRPPLLSGAGVVFHREQHSSCIHWSDLSGWGGWSRLFSCAPYREGCCCRPVVWPCVYRPGPEQALVAEQNTPPANPHRTALRTHTSKCMARGYTEAGSLLLRCVLGTPPLPRARILYLGPSHLVTPAFIVLVGDGTGGRIPNRYTPRSRGSG